MVLFIFIVFLFFLYFANFDWRRKQQLTPVFLLENPARTCQARVHNVTKN